MALKRATFERIFDSAWTTGLVTLLGGLGSAIVVNWFPNSASVRMTAISLIAALVATNIVRQVNSARDEMKRESELARELIHNAIDISELSRLTGEIRQPFLHNVAVRVIRGAQVALKQLAGKADNKFRSHGEYMAWATRLIQRLPEKGRILAVCGDKDWESYAVRKFNQANCDAARTGCRVERIFLQLDPKGFSIGEKTVLDEHLRTKREGGNMAAYVIRPVEAAQLIKQNGLPNGFGFTFIDGATDSPVVLLHWGFTNKNDEGLRIESPLVPAIIEQIYDEFRHDSYEYDGQLRP